MLRTIIVCFVASGCIHHWVRVDDPRRVRDERVRVEFIDGTAATLEHAHACGPTTIGGERAGEPRCDCVWTCRIADVRYDRVRARRVHGWATAGLASGIAFAVLGALVAWVAAAGSVGGG